MIDYNTLGLVGDNFCGFIGDGSRPGDKVRLAVCGIVIIGSVCLAIHYTMRWIAHWDYFPIKYRTPLLNLLLLYVVLTDICLYPFQICLSYATYGGYTTFDRGKAFSIGYYSLKYVSYFIYMVRSLRIIFAYRVSEYMREHWVFQKVFARYNVLLVIILVMMTVKASIVTWIAYSNNESFYEILISPINYDVLSSDGRKLFLMKKLVGDLPWTIILLVCLWLERHVDKKLGVHTELAWVVIFEVLYHMIEVVIVFSFKMDFTKILTSNCFKNMASTLVIVQSAQHLLMFIVSIVLPLRADRLRKHHQYLRVMSLSSYKAVSTHFTEFLMVYSSWSTFMIFLKHLDLVYKSNYNQLTLECWSTIIKFKYVGPYSEDLLYLLIKLNKLNNNTLDYNLRRKARQLLEDSQRKNVTTNRYHLIKTINQIMQEIYEALLGRLWKIFRYEYVKTRSFMKLQENRENNFRINTNMKQLNMFIQNFEE